MPGAILPPFASPSGPELSLERILDSFIEGGRTGFSEELHIEGDTLMAQRDIPLGARMGLRSLLVRDDIPADVLALKDAVEDHFRLRGLFLIDPDCRLGDVAAIQVTGIRGGVWDLWGDDSARAMQDMEKTVLGTDGLGGDAMNIQFEEPPEADTAQGMTLEDLLGEIEEEK